MCQENQKEEDLLVLKIVWMPQYEVSNTKLKRLKKG